MNHFNDNLVIMFNNHFYLILSCADLQGSIELSSHTEAEHLQCVLRFFVFLQICFGFLVSVYYALCILILFLFLNTFAGPNDVYQIEI